MKFEVEIANPDDAGRTYLTWRPVRASIRVTEVDAGPAVQVTLVNLDPAEGGQLEFSTGPQLPRIPALKMFLPTSGTPVEFWVAGVFGRPSTDDGDAAIAVSTPAGQVEVKRLMVRVRKDANLITPAERKRLTDALGTLNDQGAGLFRNFREMHRTS